MLLWVTVGIGVTAILFSAFFGLKACEIFSVQEPKKVSQRFYLFWFNFVGSLLGWLVLWVILFKILRCIDSACQAEINIGDFILVLVAFAGITGHLPMATMGIFTGLGNISKGLFKKWLG